MTREKNAVGRDIYVYRPNIGYLGKDRFEAVVPVGNDAVRIIYNIVVQPDLTDQDGFDHRKFCPKTEWKISSPSTLTDPSPFQSILDQSGLDSSAVTLQVADLPGSSLGQTTGTSITLDTTAAGHGWYIDYTPYLNEEYLPTSNPYEWIAKEDSAASGKMDMLSVLLHEYGHALGIDHSADAHDLMAATLTPGVRRLPSIDELALMARLVGEIKAGMEPPAAPSTPDTPQPGAPFPSNGPGSVRVTRARITRNGTFVTGEDGVEREQPPQYEIAANPTLTDPKLQTGAGWETTGSVSIGNGAAILSETTRSQTRLNQVFIVGEHDRYLTFTLAGIALDDQASAPDDAFEAALLDANSGTSLLAGTGLTKNDAFLNLQADGFERAGQNVTSTLNPDGSRTYRIDLAGIPAGTAVNLSFDLIGFGPATSQITVRDIRLGVPETHDDTAVTLEDTPIDIAVTANDLDADQPGFTPVIVSGPAHGSVALNATGGFTYTPDANWNGEDSFTYKLSDGAVDSNIAKVSLGVTAVNDAPVAGDIAASLLEDGSVTLDLLANAYDIDGDALTVTAADPANGALTRNEDGSFTYRPVADWNGEDGFAYTVSDGELTATAFVRLTIAAVADTPALVLADSPGASRELFRTGWETVRNKNGTSTLVEQHTLEGWTAITHPDPSHGGDNGFEIWSTGDRMMNADKRFKTVAAAEGDGLNWLELNDARGEGHQTLGIRRDVETIAGATYTLGFDYAGRIGYSADTTRIGLYLDDRKIGEYAHTSPTDALNWQALQFSFTGSGGTQALRIVTEATQLDRNGRGAMIDDIALVETLPPNTGFEDSPIPLSRIDAALTDIDGSETLKVEIEALPVGVTLTDGTHSFTATTADGATADVTGWRLSNLSILPPQDWSGSLTLKVVATATEQSNGDQSVTATDLTVAVLPVNDAPVARNAVFTMEEGGSLRIDFSALVSDVDSNVLTLTLGKPEHGKLTRNSDGTYTYTPKKHFDGVDGFSVTVSDGSLTATGWISIEVEKGDHHHHHHDHGYHHGHDHSRHHGYPERDDGRSACIVVRSTDPNAVPVHIDWDGKPSDGFMSLPVNQPEWLAEFLGIPQPDRRTLAEITGLVVRVEE